MALSRRKPGTNGAIDWEKLAKEEFCFAYPCVLEFLSRAAWEPGVPRLTGTVLILCDAQLWKLWAHDRDAGESLFTSGSTLEEAFLSLERHLADGSGEWRADKGGKSGPGKKGT